MALSFLVPNRTILLVADEALYIYACSAKGMRLVEIVPWESENFQDDVARIIVKDCGGKPVLILNDMVEQHYRKERVVRRGVSIMDRSSMLKHKLYVAFPNYPVRAAYALKEKAPKAGKKDAADIYIFSAIPDSKQLGQTIEAVRRSLVQIAGFALLPVEASDMIKALASKVQRRAQSGAQWVVFIGQHKHGGLRQIVIKNGELALTRMSPVMESDENPQAWAADVQQEFNATMSYLTRFGFQQEDGLHIIMVAGAESGEALERMVGETYSFSTLTTAEAARLLGVPLGPQDEYRFADTLHAAWVGRKARMILPMKSTEIDRIAIPRKIAVVASFLLFCGIAFLGYQLMNEAMTMSTINTEIQDNNDKRAQLDVQYQKEVKRNKDLGIDVRLVQSSIAVYDALDKNNIRPLPFYQDVGKALGRDMRVDRVTIQRSKNLTNAASVPAVEGAAKSPVFEAKMQMTYPSTADVQQGNKEVEDLRDRLQALLTGGETVEVTKRLKDYEYIEEMVVETGDISKQNVGQDFIAEITVRGPLQQ